MTVEELLQKMESGSDILIVDTRGEDEYDSAHIKGAVPLSVIVDGKWVPSGDAEVIIYCN
jgi:rhodanese-related sulfurtransferase